LMPPCASWFKPGPRRVTARRLYLLMPWLENLVRLADEKCRRAGVGPGAPEPPTIPGRFSPHCRAHGAAPRWPSPRRGASSSGRSARPSSAGGGPSWRSRASGTSAAQGLIRSSSKPGPGCQNSSDEAGRGVGASLPGGSSPGMPSSGPASTPPRRARRLPITSSLVRPRVGSWPAPAPARTGPALAYDIYAYATASAESLTTSRSSEVESSVSQPSPEPTMRSPRGGRT
jgi:hypothetical protein